MAFSLRKMLSNINYFSKSGEETDSNDVSFNRRRHSTFNSSDSTTKSLKYDRPEPDSTSLQYFQLPESVKNFAAKKGSLSDTDIFDVNVGLAKKRKCKKLKLDIKKASQSMTESLNLYNDDSSNCVENTPKHILLDCKSADAFSERLKKFDFDRSFDFSETISVCSSYDEENIDLDSISDHTDTDMSNDGTTVKMCRKVIASDVPSITPESFGDVEDKNEEERMNLLLNYKLKLEKIECLLQKLLTEFQFHVEVSKIFKSKSIVTTLPGSVVSSIPKVGELRQIDDNMNRGVSPSWNIVMEKEDSGSKANLKKQLLSIKEVIEKFIDTHLDNSKKIPRRYSWTYPNTMLDLEKSEQVHRQNKLKNKKKIKYFDFPDLREAMINLFGSESDKEDLSVSGNNITNLLSDNDDLDSQKCSCKCHNSIQTDSGLTTKTDPSDQSITSSIGNFTLDSTTLSAYSESLDMMVTYNSFQDTSLYTTLLQKSAVERISFYVQVHSVQLKCELPEQDFESKNVIMFHCPSCNITENEENGLLRHILSQEHCEKLHFVYKTAYIKKCMSSGKEILPSTVLNPMVMYRDDNKIVCFGDAMFACTLCFENLIVGESVLMAHCSSEEHVCRRERLSDIIG